MKKINERIYNLLFDNEGYLKDNYSDLKELQEFKVLSSGEQAIADFMVCLYNGSQEFNIYRLNEVDEETRSLMIDEIKNKYI